jgi:hypothetical protein
MGEIDPTGRRAAALDAFLVMKLREGFEIEAHQDTHAIVVEPRSFLRRMFSASPRYVVSVDEHGSVSMSPAEPKRS